MSPHQSTLVFMLPRQFMIDIFVYLLVYSGRSDLRYHVDLSIIILMSVNVPYSGKGLRGSSGKEWLHRWIVCIVHMGTAASEEHKEKIKT